jgi:hypothetical protein
MLKVTDHYYVACNDKTTNTNMQKTVVYIRGQRMQYKVVEMNRLRGIIYNVYELKPVPEPWWRRYICIKTKQFSSV